MRKLFRQLKLNFAYVSLYVIGIASFFIPAFIPFGQQEDNFYLVRLNGEEVGYTGTVEEAGQYLRVARRKIAKSSEEMLFIDADLEVEGQTVFWGQATPEDVIIENMVQNLSAHEERTMERCYTLKMGEYTINMYSLEDIEQLLLAGLYQYDPDKTYTVRLIADDSREISVKTTQVMSVTEREEDESKKQSLPLAGIEAQLSEFFDSVTPSISMNFEDYTKGLQTIDFDDKIEICEAYMPDNQISSLEDALADVTGEVDRNEYYEAQYGDSPIGIADKFGLTLEELCAMNASLDYDNPQVMVGDTFVVTVKQPKLSIAYTVRRDYEEEYSADTIYKKNDEWYTNKSEVVQTAVNGRRRVIADVSYRDSILTGTNIIKQETLKEAVPQIIEVGTINPPTYIWPVSTGYISSNFGYRSRPNARASSNHQGTDIAVSVGTTVRASSGGTVTVAGWQGGYGNVVYIDHGDGRQTRYGHLSRVLVSVGQTVSQGERIALSGNTGNSTGPHLHFELRINGTAVNPVNYISQ